MGRSRDIFTNCVYVDSKNPSPPFVTRESLSVPERRLRVICDFSCDPNSEHNPVPVYTEYSTFWEPSLPVDLGGDGPGLAVVSIDHLPSLQTLSRRSREGVWARAETLYREKVKELPVNA